MSTAFKKVLVWCTFTANFTNSCGENKFLTLLTISTDNYPEMRHLLVVCWHHVMEQMEDIPHWVEKLNGTGRRTNVQEKLYKQRRCSVHEDQLIKIWLQKTGSQWRHTSSTSINGTSFPKRGYNNDLQNGSIHPKASFPLTHLCSASTPSILPVTNGAKSQANVTCSRCTLQRARHQPRRSLGSLESGWLSAFTFPFFPNAEMSSHFLEQHRTLKVFAL